MKIGTLQAFRQTIRLWGDTQYETDDTGQYSLIPIAVSSQLDKLLMLAKADFKEQDAKSRRKGKPAGRPELDLPSSEEIRQKLEWKNGRCPRGNMKRLAKELRCSPETIRNRVMRD